MCKTIPDHDGDDEEEDDFDGDEDDGMTWYD